MAQPSGVAAPSDCDPAGSAQAEQFAQERDADVYLYSGTIEWDLGFKFCKCVHDNKKKRNAALILTTIGGDGDVAYRMARALQENYDGGHISIHIVGQCKSAGTILTIGAKEIVMSDLAELGPLDIQITKPDTLGERTSGLTPGQSLSTLREEAFQCFEKFFLQILAASGYAITTRTAAIIAAKVTAGLFRPIYAQIDPMQFGEFQRAMQIAMEYGKRLNQWSMNLKDKALTRLVGSYPSHEFVIDRMEAETLFNHVGKPTVAESKLIELLESHFDLSLGGRHATFIHLAPKPQQRQQRNNGKRAAPNPTGTRAGTAGSGESASRIGGRSRGGNRRPANGEGI